jgi:Asp-tRNA(Asn)/Glu-tRNA(Gln) amidotransferase A subunit family amidase
MARGVDGFVGTANAAGAVVGDAASLGLDAACAWLVRLRELAHAHELPLTRDPGGYTDSMKGMLQAFGAVTVQDYVDSFAVAASLRERVDNALEGVDALVLPVNPHPAMRWHEWHDQPVVLDWYRFCWPFNLTSHPGIMIPWTLNDNGLPIAVQLIAHLGGEQRLLDVAARCVAQGSFDSAPVGARIDSS